MHSFSSRAVKAGLAGLAFLGMAVPAGATIYDISATEPGGVEVSLAAGSYIVKWVGKADGGLYDAANVTLCGQQSCSTGFSNAFFAGDEDLGSNNFEVDVYSTGSVYGTAADSLAAYKSGNNIMSNTIHFVNGSVQGSVFNGFLPNPWIITTDGIGTARLFVADADKNLDNNSGGVSLSIESLGAVPEPATWAMMIAGFGAVGLAMRRREKLAVRFA